MKKFLTLLFIVFILIGCDRGPGQEPVDVNVSEKDLLGTWVLSKEHTYNKLITYLGNKISERYFILKPNNELIYHDFNAWRENVNDPEILKINGEWEFIGKDIQLSGPHIGKVYISANGWHSINPNSTELVEPIKTKIVHGSKFIARFSITKINNKLLLWEYEGDPDAIRYIMYEKKE